MGELNSLEDKSNQRSYWIQTPQLAWAMSRTPYDFTLWNTIYMIAGEKGECILSTEDLASLSMMSVAKASDSRAYLLAIGLLQGSITKDEGQSQAVWHLSVPDFWEENIKWRKLFDPLKGDNGRIALKNILKDIFQKTGIHRRFDEKVFKTHPLLKDLHISRFHNMNDLKSLRIVKPSHCEGKPSHCEGKPSHCETKKNQEEEPSFITINKQPPINRQEEQPTIQPIEEIAEGEHSPLDPIGLTIALFLKHAHKSAPDNPFDRQEWETETERIYSRCGNDPALTAEMVVWAIETLTRARTRSGQHYTIASPTSLYKTIDNELGNRQREKEQGEIREETPVVITYGNYKDYTIVEAY